MYLKCYDYYNIFYSFEAKFYPQKKCLTQIKKRY